MRKASGIHEKPGADRKFPVQLASKFASLSNTESDF
jgi:hypothetical protein